MYKDVPFAASPMDEIRADVMEAAFMQPWADRVFLESGDAFCLSTERLLEVASLVEEHLPAVDTITGYARIGNIATKTDDELKALFAAGYDQLNVGVESGLDDVLLWMNKGYTADDALCQLGRLRAVGMRFSLNIINAAAGPGRCAESAAANAAFCNAAQPYLIFVSPLHVDPGTRLEDDVAAGLYTECTLGDYIDEEIAFLEGLEMRDCVFFGLHVSNPVPVAGHLPEGKGALLTKLKAGKSRFSQADLESHPTKGSEGRLYL